MSGRPGKYWDRSETPNGMQVWRGPNVSQRDVPDGAPPGHSVRQKPWEPESPSFPETRDGNPAASAYIRSRTLDTRRAIRGTRVFGGMSRRKS